MGSTGTTVHRDRPTTREHQSFASCPPLSPIHLQYGAWIRSIPWPNSVLASWSEWVICLVKCGACVQHDKRAVNDRSLIDIHRTTMVKHPHKALPGLNLFLNTWLSTMIANILPSLWCPLLILDTQTEKSASAWISVSTSPGRYSRESLFIFLPLGESVHLTNPNLYLTHGLTRQDSEIWAI